MGRREGRKGQALVETSLVLIALLLTIVAIIDFGRFLFLEQALTDRARAGARRPPLLAGVLRLPVFSGCRLRT